MSRSTLANLSSILLSLPLGLVLGWTPTARAAEAGAPDASQPAADAAGTTPGAAAGVSPTDARIGGAGSAEASLPFRLGLFYAHAFGQSGDLTRFIGPGGTNSFQLPSPSAVGVDLGIGLGSHVRYHFGVALEWESQDNVAFRANYAAKGFRFDLTTLGFPILAWSNQDVAIHVEPMVHLIRGEILFQSEPSGVQDSSLFRIEAGAAAAVTAVSHHWFVALEPLSIDFRVFEANNHWVHTGFSHLWWFQLTAGREL